MHRLSFSGRFILLFDNNIAADLVVDNDKKREISLKFHEITIFLFGILSSIESTRALYVFHW